MLDKCERGIKISPLWHSCLALLSTCAKGVQFYCPSRTYAAIPYSTIFRALCDSTSQHYSIDSRRTLEIKYYLGYLGYLVAFKILHCIFPELEDPNLITEKETKTVLQS